MIIKNVKIFQEDHAFHAGVIYLQDGMIEHIQPESELDGAEPIPQEGEQVIDGRGCYAIPGMIDLHFHGCIDRCHGDFTGNNDALWGRAGTCTGKCCFL